ncbi:MAG: M23 family metallopeptidase [Alphaproteobacteria bacterium]
MRRPTTFGAIAALAACCLLAGAPALAEEQSPPAAFLEPFPDVMAHIRGQSPDEAAATADAEMPAQPAQEVAQDVAGNVAQDVVDAAEDEAAETVQYPAVFEPIGGPLTPDMMPEIESGGVFRGSASLAEAYGPEISRQVAFGVVPRIEAGPVTATLVVESGDTMAGLFTDAGIGYGEALAAIESLDGIWDPRQLRVGQQVAVTFVPGSQTDERPVLVGFAMELSYDRRITVARTEDGAYRVHDEAIDYDTALHRATGAIASSLYADGNAAGIPNGILAAMTRAFSYDVDFQRSLQPGDAFEAVFEESVDQGGRVVATGDLVYAALTLSGDELQIYRFVRGDGSVDYFTPEGTSVRKALLRTPVDAARISSGYGMRQHPILGYSRMHAGVDFAAPTGTPVYAAGDGTIAVAGWNRGYGNYVRIRHNGTTQTAYAHLSRFAAGITPGTRVRQGQVVAYVGSTGLATGPHLHYEVLINGAQVNPLSVQLPPGEPLVGAELDRFQAWRRDFDTERLAMGGEPTAETAVARSE